MTLDEALAIRVYLMNHLPVGGCTHEQTEALKDADKLIYKHASQAVDVHAQQQVMKRAEAWRRKLRQNLNNSADLIDNA